MNGTILFRVGKCREDKLAGALKHNLREITSYGHTARHGIDLTKSSLNSLIRGGRSSESVVEDYQRIIQQQGVRKRSNCVDFIEVIVSVHAGFEPAAEYFEESVRFLERYWGCAVLSAVIHCDQANPHVHILIAPFLNGRRLGSKLVGYKGAAEARIQAFHREVGSKYGLSLQSHYSASQRKELTLRTCAAIAEDPQRLFKGHLARPLQEVISANIQRIAPFLARVECAELGEEL